MTPEAAVEVLETSVRERFAEIVDARVGLIVAAAAWVSGRVLADEHFARSEAEQIRRALAADFAPDEIEWIVDALTRHRRALASIGDTYWFRRLYPLVFGCPAPTGPSGDAYANLFIELRIRWPFFPDVTSPVLAGVLEATPQGVQVGRPFSIHSLAIAWSWIDNLEAVDPWPQVLIEWTEAGVFYRARVAPSGDPEEFDAEVEALFAAAERRLPLARLTDGWLARPRARWEDVDDLPTGEERYGDVSYRSWSRPDPIVARRPPRGGLGAVLEWLASSPQRPFRAMPREAVLTESYLYVRRRDGRVQRISLDLLEAGRGSSDRFYRFGRGAEILFTDAERCPVCAGLDARLASRA